MSDSKKDKRGGHKMRRNGMYSCGCCDILQPNHESRNRTRRERETRRYEETANTPPAWAGDLSKQRRKRKL